MSTLRKVTKNPRRLTKPSVLPFLKPFMVWMAQSRVSTSALIIKLRRAPQALYRRGSAHSWYLSLGWVKHTRLFTHFSTWPHWWRFKDCTLIFHEQTVQNSCVALAVEIYQYFSFTLRCTSFREIDLFSSASPSLVGQKTLVSPLLVGSSFPWRALTRLFINLNPKRLLLVRARFGTMCTRSSPHMGKSYSYRCGWFHSRWRYVCGSAFLDIILTCD